MSRILKTGSNQITQAFGGSHGGIDIVKYSHQLDYIVAHSDGTVSCIQTGHKNKKGATGMSSYGNMVIIEHDNGYFTYYAHLATVYVKKGDKVKQGQTIGFMGNTGNSYGAHLHFEVRDKNKTRLDPTAFIDANLPVILKEESYYTIKKGDTLTAIAKNFDLTINEIARLNGIENSNLIYVGQVLKLNDKSLKSTQEVAQEVINGLWKNGKERKKLLEQAGYNYSLVQAKVNDILKK